MQSISSTLLIPSQQNQQQYPSLTRSLLSLFSPIKHCRSRSLSQYQPALYPRYQNPPGRSQPIGRAKNTTSPSIHNMDVDHRRTQCTLQAWTLRSTRADMLLSKHKRPGAYARRATSVKRSRIKSFGGATAIPSPYGNESYFRRRGTVNGFFRPRGPGKSSSKGRRVVVAAVIGWPGQAREI